MFGRLQVGIAAFAIAVLVATPSVVHANALAGIVFDDDCVAESSSMPPQIVTPGQGQIVTLIPGLPATGRFGSTFVALAIASSVISAVSRCG